MVLKHAIIRSDGRCQRPANQQSSLPEQIPRIRESHRRGLRTAPWGRSLTNVAAESREPRLKLVGLSIATAVAQQRDVGAHRLQQTGVVGRQGRFWDGQRSTERRFGLGVALLSQE
jgi:hypothetical protein